VHDSSVSFSATERDVCCLMRGLRSAYCEVRPILKHFYLGIRPNAKDTGLGINQTGCLVNPTSSLLSHGEPRMTVTIQYDTISKYSTCTHKVTCGQVWSIV